jgi:hypothetical protein
MTQLSESVNKLLALKKKRRGLTHGRVFTSVCQSVGT